MKSVSNTIFSVSEFWVNVLPTFRLVMLILIVVLCLSLVVLVLVQPSADQQGLNAVSGQQSDTYYAKNKSETRESMYKRLTIILSIALAVAVILFFVSVMIYSGINA